MLVCAESKWVTRDIYHQIGVQIGGLEVKGLNNFLFKGLTRIKNKKYIPLIKNFPIGRNPLSSRVIEGSWNINYYLKNKIPHYILLIIFSAVVGNYTNVSSSDISRLHPFYPFVYLAQPLFADIRYHICDSTAIIFGL